MPEPDDTNVETEPRIQLRRLAVRDAEAILDFLLALDAKSVEFFHPHEFDLNHVVRLLRGRLGGAVDAFGAFAEGRPELLGYVWLSGMETDHPSLGLCVRAGHRGKGIGRALMQRALNEAVLRAKKEVRLTVVTSNEVALGLYRSLGFEITETTPDATPPMHGMVCPCPTDVGARARAIRERLQGCRIHVVPYTHCDWAWVHTRHWHAQRYALVLEETLNTLERRPDYRWYVDSVACQLDAMVAQKPELLPRLRRAVAEGSIDVCGGYANVRPNMVGDETFVRNLQMGREAFERILPEARIRTHADAVDVSVGHAQMPQLLRQAGFPYLRMWRPYAAISLKGVPNEFVWRGIDGSEVLAVRGCYGGLWSFPESGQCLKDPRSATADAVLCALWDGDLEIRARYATTPELWLAVGCDDVRPNRLIDDTPFDTGLLIDALNERESCAVSYATPTSVFTRLEALRAELDVIEGTLDPCDVAYNAAWNGELGLGTLRVANDRRLVSAETFAALASVGCFEAPEGEMDRLWRQHLLTCAHATQWLYEPDYAEMRRRADEVALAAERIAGEAVDALCRQVGPPEDAVWVVANPLPFARRVVAPLTLSRFGDIWPPELRDAAGNRLAHQVVGEHVGQGGYREQEVLAAVDVPPCGLAVLRQTQAEAPETPPSPVVTRSASRRVVWPRICNGRITLGLVDGRITEIVDRHSKKTYDAPLGLEWGGVVLKTVDVAAGPLHVGPITAESVCEWTHGVVLEDGPVRWRYRRTGTIGDMAISVDALLDADEPRIDFEVRTDWPGHDGFLSARVPLPVPVRLYGDIPFGVEAKDIAGEPYGMDHWVLGHSMERTRDGLFYARSFVAAQSEDCGYALIGVNTDRYYLRHSIGSYLEHILINSVVTQDDWERRVEQSTLTGRGSHCFRFSLLVYAGDWREGGVVRQSAALRDAPMVRELVRSPGAPTSAPASLLSVEPESVVMTACYRDRADLVLRLHETHGTKAVASVVLPFEPAAVAVVDLLGRPEPDLAAARVTGRTVRVDLAPWRIATLRIKP